MSLADFNFFQKEFQHWLKQKSIANEKKIGVSLLKN